MRGFNPRKGIDNKINQEIKSTTVRVVGVELDGVVDGIYSFRDAMALAETNGVDLICINETSNPPICKLMELSKFKFEKKKRDKDNKKKQSAVVLKEVRLGQNTGEHDLDTKVRQSREFLQKGNKVKALIFFKGREIVHKDRGELILLKFIQSLEDVGKPEALPKLEGKRLFVTLIPKK